MDSPAEWAAAIREAGVAGAGGAGFPSYAKWERADSTDYLLVNHQESEPNFFVDKWLGRARAAELASLFDAALDGPFEVVVVAAKWDDREGHLTELEAETDGTVVPPSELPLDPGDESGVVFAYTDSEYQYGMESVLLTVVADTVVGDDLPMDHGWIVQNTETLYNVYRALTEGAPVTRKYVHVGGNVPDHRFLDVPVGTPLGDLLAAAGLPPAELPDDAVLAHGGPGWCFPIGDAPDRFGVRKHTNCVLVLDEATVEENTLGGDRIDVLDAYDWTGRSLETEPTATVEPEFVRIPHLTNPQFEGVVRPSDPVVEVGDAVAVGEEVAAPRSEGVSIPQHASVDGTVTAVDESSVEITT